LMVMQRHGHQFEWVNDTPGAWLDYPSGWIETRYAAKARREGRIPHQFRFARLGERAAAP
jgi:tRNA (guanine-N7-)-methyltransferase